MLPWKLLTTRHFRDSILWWLCLSIRMKANIIKSIKSNTTPDPGHHIGKWNYARKHRIQKSQEVKPFLSRWLQVIDKSAWQTWNTDNKKNPRKKHRLGTISEKYWRDKTYLTAPASYFLCGLRQVNVWYSWMFLTNRCIIL